MVTRISLPSLAALEIPYCSQAPRSHALLHALLLPASKMLLTDVLSHGKCLVRPACLGLTPPGACPLFITAEKGGVARAKGVEEKEARDPTDLLTRTSRRTVVFKTETPPS